jgi:GT2 family glycosyltransferase
MSVSLIWLNYNSMDIINIARQSLKSLLNLNYDNYEIIFVDNASTDGSDQKLLEILSADTVKFKYIKNNSNQGYTGGMNTGFNYSSGEYIAFITNDVLVEPDSVFESLKYFDKQTACVGGYLLNNNYKIFSAGNWVDSMLRAGTICGGLTTGECKTIDTPHLVSYVDGAYMICKKAVLQLIGGPFIKEAFAYLDDDLLGIKLWNSGYKVKYVPVYYGIHFVHQTFNRTGKLNYYRIRGYLAKLLTVRGCNPMLLELQKMKAYIKYRQLVSEATKLAEIVKTKWGNLYLKLVPHIHHKDEALAMAIPYYKTFKSKLQIYSPILHDKLKIH